MDLNLTSLNVSEPKETLMFQLLADLMPVLPDDNTQECISNVMDDFAKGTLATPSFEIDHALL